MRKCHRNSVHGRIISDQCVFHQSSPRPGSCSRTTHTSVELPAVPGRARGSSQDLGVIERNGDVPKSDNPSREPLFSSTCSEAIVNKSLATIIGGVLCMASCVATHVPLTSPPLLSSKHFASIACISVPHDLYMLRSFTRPSSLSRPFSTFKGSRISPLFVRCTRSCPSWSSLAHPSFFLLVPDERSMLQAQPTIRSSLALTACTLMLLLVL